jgi:peroxiredoxin
MSSISIGETAPAFQLNGIDGKSYKLNKDGARLTLAVFFKTTCPTCRMAWPYVEKLYQQYRAAGLAVWGITQDARADSAEFAADRGSTFPILMDRERSVSRAYGPQFVPTLLLVDRGNTIQESVVAFDKAGLNRLAQAIAARLNAPAVIVAAADDGNPAFKPG